MCEAGKGSDCLVFRWLTLSRKIGEMASNVLRLAARSVLSRRITSVGKLSQRKNSYAIAERAALQDLSDPNINHEFSESLTDPIPTKPRMTASSGMIQCEIFYL